MLSCWTACSVFPIVVPSLLVEKPERGGLESALAYFNFCARLESQDFQRAIDMSTPEPTLGVTGISRQRFTGGIPVLPINPEATATQVLNGIPARCGGVQRSGSATTLDSRTFFHGAAGPDAS